MVFRKKSIVITALIWIGLSFASDDDLHVRSQHEMDLKKAPTSVENQKKKEGLMDHIGFDYEEQSMEVIEGFAGRAYYSYAIEVNRDKTLLNIGGGYQSAEAKVIDFKSEEKERAMAEISLLFERAMKSNLSRVWGIGLSQPVYDTKGEFNPTITMNYGIKF
ncbi:MAG: hypothetical protein K9M07_04465 [Simkaniaceae bacterium]|nr:hypothetical protein [Simkaniaceae bacterium]